MRKNCVSIALIKINVIYIWFWDWMEILVYFNQLVHLIRMVQICLYNNKEKLCNKILNLIFIKLNSSLKV